MSAELIGPNFRTFVRRSGVVGQVCGDQRPKPCVGDGPYCAGVCLYCVGVGSIARGNEDRWPIAAWMAYVVNVGGPRAPKIQIWADL